MSAYPEVLEISETHRQEMLAHIQGCVPEEACGLLGGRLLEGGGRVELVLPVENELHSPVRFRMSPSEQLKSFYRFEEHGLELLAIFHSHPKGPAYPSATDLAEFAYPGVVTLIWSPENVGDGWQMQAFAIEEGKARTLRTISLR